VSLEADEGVTVTDPGDQAERRVRPLSRRDFSTARPPRVLIRARKPCLRLRRRLLGWNVRFTTISFRRFDARSAHFWSDEISRPRTDPPMLRRRGRDSQPPSPASTSMTCR
jgi:hypothetical protein